jgi:hypothetical protein
MGNCCSHNATAVVVPLPASLGTDEIVARPRCAPDAPRPLCSDDMDTAPGTMSLPGAVASFTDSIEPEPESGPVQQEAEIAPADDRAVGGTDTDQHEGSEHPAEGWVSAAALDPDEAATRIQQWWMTNRDNTLFSFCSVFQGVGLTAAWARSVAFEELALCLQRDDLLHVISALLQRITDAEHLQESSQVDPDEGSDSDLGGGPDDSDGGSAFMTEPSRVLLSAYVVSTHPEVVFADSNLRSGTRQEQNLRAASNMLISSLETLCQAVVDGSKDDRVVLLDRFQKVWAEYMSRFTVWKQTSTAFLTDELVAAYLELEAAKLAADGTETGLVTSMGGISALSSDDILGDDGAILESDTDGDGTDDGEVADGCLDEIEARQNTIRAAIKRNGTGAELKLQQALDQYSSTQQAANAQLAHEIILNPDLQLLPARDPDMLRVRGIATRAFWSSVRDEVRTAAEGQGQSGSERSPQFGRVLSLLTEVREGLVGLTTNAQFTEDVCEALDIDFLQQQMEHGSLNYEDVRKLLNFVVEKIIELDAPAYEDDSRAWLRGLVESLADSHTPSDFAQFVVEIFAWLFAKLEQIRVGVANFHLRSLSAVLRSHGVEYEQAAFVQQVMRGDQQLKYTLQWLKEVIEEEGIDLIKLNNGDIRAVSSVPKLGIVRLCLKATALLYDECPETLRMDLMRLLTFQNQAQRLAVVGATIIVLQQVLVQHGLGNLASADDDETNSLSDTLYVSLQRPEIRLPALIDHVVKVADTHVRHVQLLRRARGETNTKDLNKNQLRRMLEVTVSPSNQVFMLVMKRVGKVLRSFVLDRVIPEGSDVGGLEVVMPRVRQLAVNVASLCDHNHKVHAQRYSQLVRHVVRD